MSKLISRVALGLFLAPAACASANAAKAPAQAVPAAVASAPKTAVAANTVATLPPLPATPAPAMPAPATPATAAVAPSADALPQLPSSTASTPASPPLPASASSPSPSSVASAAPTPPSPPPPPPGVEIADERPFVATAAPPSQPAHRPRGHHGSSTSSSSSASTSASGSSPSTSASAPTASTPHRRHGHDAHAAAHPDPRIVVDVTAVQGTVQQTEVQRTARARGWGLIRSCYAEGLRRNQRLAGHFAFDISVGDGGTATVADRKATTFADPSVTACVAREIAHLPLFKPENAGASVAFQITLSPGDDPIPVPRAARNADKLREDLRGRWSGVEVCFREGLERHADLGGRLELRLRVRPNGEVADVAEGDTHFADADVTRCVVELYQDTQFHRFGGRQDQSFVYALHLEPLAPLAPREHAPSRDHDDAPNTHDTRDTHDTRANDDDANDTTNEH